MQMRTAGMQLGLVRQRLVGRTAMHYFLAKPHRVHYGTYGRTIAQGDEAVLFYRLRHF